MSPHTHPPTSPVAYVAPCVFNMVRGEAVAIDDLNGSMVNPLLFRLAEFAKTVDSVVTPPPVNNNHGVWLEASCAKEKR